MINVDIVQFYTKCHFIEVSRVASEVSLGHSIEAVFSMLSEQGVWQYEG